MIRFPRPLAVLVPLALAVGGLASAARADIAGDQVVAGPSNTILEVDGAAMAADGTGGIVYRQLVGGVAHVFVVPIQHGVWGAPTEVDTDDPYGASEPAIGAGDNGRLLVVWVQPRGVESNGVVVDELMSASAGPGSSTFGAPTTVDPTVSERNTGDATAVDPRLAMAADGDAYVVYRVVDDDCLTTSLDANNPENGECPPTSTGSQPTAQVVEVRVARFNQGPWSSLGEVNRAPQLAMRPSTSSNEPAIAIANGRAGLVVWQEPDASGVARIWSRRLFGTTLGNVIELSPTTINSVAVGADADEPAAAFDTTGLATAAFRLQGGPGSPLGAAEVMSQTVPASESEITPALDVAGSAGIGGPALSENEDGDTRIAFTAAGVAYATDSDGQTPVALGPASGAQAFTTVDPDGGGVTAWLSANPLGLPLVDVRDDFPGGGDQFGELVGGVAGPITGLSLGAGTGGDAAIAWTQGTEGDEEVVGDFVSAAPHSFTVLAPSGWQSTGRPAVAWNPAAATTPVTYSIYVDGKPLLTGITGPTATAPSTNPRFPSQPVSTTGEAATITRRLPLGSLGSGVHEVQVVATDASGQTMESDPVKLKVDRSPPEVSTKLIDGGHAVRITVADPDSGVDTRHVRIAFGDGTTTTRRAIVTHHYRSAGRYRIVAHVEDKAGNTTTVTLRVRVR